MQLRIPLCVGLPMFASVAQAQTYHLTALGNNTGVSAINDLGQVVGSDDISATGAALANPVAYLWSNGKSTTLGHGITTANDINNLGQITGGLAVGGSTHAYLYSAGRLTDLDPGDNHAVGSQGYAINNHGVVAGFYTDANVSSLAATFANGRINPLDVIPDSTGSSAALAINDRGQIAGNGGGGCGTHHCGWLVSGGQTTYVMGLGLFYETSAAAINKAGTVVGTTDVTSSSGGSTRHAYSFSHGVVTDLTPKLPDDTWSFANAVNDAGAIVGREADSAVLYAGGKALKLGSMLDASGKGWTLSNAVDINNRGQIVGVGTDAKGLTHAFLLSPVPEPATWATMLAGLAMLGSVVRRRKREISGTKD